MRGFSILFSLGAFAKPRIHILNGRMLRIVFGPLAFWVGFYDIDVLIGNLNEDRKQWLAEREIIRPLIALSKDFSTGLKEVAPHEGNAAAPSRP